MVNTVTGSRLGKDAPKFYICSGTIVEQEVFMNLDYADDVALLAEKQK